MKKAKVNNPAAELLEDLYPSHNVDIIRKLNTSMYNYAVERNEEIIPDERDGLKKGQRRSVVQAVAIGIDKKTTKLTKLGGSTMELHPHGDVGIMDGIKKMANPDYLKYPLFTGEGDFGSQGTGNGSSPRYLDVKLSKFALDVYLKDFMECPNCVTMEKTEAGDGSLEPTYLPTRLPMHLIHGVFGIGGGGFASEMPPNSLASSCDATLAHINNPDISVEAIANILRIDFPTGGIIINKSKTHDIYRQKCNGTIRVRCEIQYDEANNTATITQIPYGTTGISIKESIKDFQDKSDNISSRIKEFQDHCDRTGVEFKIIARDGVDIKHLMYTMLSKTQLESYRKFNLVFLHKGYPKDDYSLKELIAVWYATRFNTLRRKFNIQFSEQREKVMILEAMDMAVADLDKFIKIIKAGKGRPDIEQKLMKAYGFNELQAHKVSAIPAYRFNDLDRKNIADQTKTEKAKANNIEKYIKKPKLIKQYIIDEITELREKYKRPHLTKMINEDITKRNTHPNIDYILEINKNNQVSKNALLDIRTTKRGAKGVKNKFGADSFLVKVNNNDLLIFFTEKGGVYRLWCHDILPGATHPLSTYIPVTNDKIISCVALPSADTIEESSRIVITTTKGKVKSNYVSLYHKIRSDATSAITLDAGEKVFSANMAKADDYISIVTNSGLGIVYPVDEITVHKARKSKGVKAIGDLKGNYVVGTSIVSKDYIDGAGTLLLVKADGYGKRIKLSDIRLKKRGGMPITFIKSTRDNELVIAKAIPNESSTITMFSGDKTISIVAKDVPVLNRTSIGRKIFDLSKDSKVIGAIVNT